jgi:hypothetical protein
MPHCTKAHYLHSSVFTYACDRLSPSLRTLRHLTLQSAELPHLFGILISVRDENVVISNVEIATVARYASIKITPTNPNILAAQKVQLERVPVLLYRVVGA